MYYVLAHAICPSCVYIYNVYINMTSICIKQVSSLLFILMLWLLNGTQGLTRRTILPHTRRTLIYGQTNIRSDLYV